jgi:succinate dehydrogenase/fumarate reductase flavoprotein subunit
MAAAAAAAVGGASVTVLEAAPALGGTTATSGAGIWIPANPWAAAAGLEDDEDRARRYLRRVSEFNGSSAAVDSYVTNGVRVAHAAERCSALSWQYLVGFPDYHPELDGGAIDGRSLETQPVQASAEALSLVRENPYGDPPITINEESVPPDATEVEARRRAGVVTKGRAMIAAFYDVLRQHGGTVRTGVVADELLLSGGAVRGVAVDGTELPGEVVIAAGGFERNPELVRRFLSGPMTAPAGPPANQGRALFMGIRAGAAVANMSDAWYVPAMQAPGETIDGAPFYRMLFTEPSRPGGILVDQRGQRFVNEALNYYGLGRSLQALDVSSFSFPRARSWFIFDAGRRRQGLRLAGLGEGDDPAWLIEAQSIGALADVIGLEPARLQATVDRFNRLADGGLDSDFGRGDHPWDKFSTGVGVYGSASPLRGVVEPPFFAIEVLAGCSGTKGGLLTDGLGRVLAAEGDDVIEGLYAAGNAAAYPFGLGYPGPGATVGPALVFGWLAGETAASNG